jgi:hypothetical protein
MHQNRPSHRLGSSTCMFPRDEARRIAANIESLPAELVVQADPDQTFCETDCAV